MKPIAYALRNSQGYWVGIWNDRETAEMIKAKGIHDEQIVPLRVADEPGTDTTPTERTTMNAPATTIPGSPINCATLALGTLLDNGDRLAGRIRIGDDLHAVLLPPKSVREHQPAVWNGDHGRVAGALSYCDGHANTIAMANAGSAIAQYALDHGLYIPARDELECIYRNFKPGADTYNQWRSGDNPSSIPPGYPYTTESPVQTAIEEFRTGSAEALPGGWVWSSTQYAPNDDYAWCQYFSDGLQISYPKSDELEVVLVRRLPIR